MDLGEEAQRLQLDLLAVAASAALSAAAVPHALLKGPSTANWLYRPPRLYRDVDLLVPLSRLDDATVALAASGWRSPQQAQSARKRRTARSC